MVKPQKYINSSKNSHNSLHFSQCMPNFTFFFNSMGILSMGVCTCVCVCLCVCVFVCVCVRVYLPGFKKITQKPLKTLTKIT